MGSDARVPCGDRRKGTAFPSPSLDGQRPSHGIVLAYVNSVVPFLWRVVRAALHKWGCIELNFYAAGQFRRSDGGGLLVDMPVLMLEFRFDSADFMYKQC